MDNQFPFSANQPYPPYDIIAKTSSPENIIAHHNDNPD